MKFWRRCFDKLDTMGLPCPDLARVSITLPVPTADEVAEWERDCAALLAGVQKLTDCNLKENVNGQSREGAWD